MTDKHYIDTSYYSKLGVYFKNSQTGEKRPVYFNIHNNRTAQKWATFLEKDYIKSKDYIRLEKKFMLHGWKFADDNPNARTLEYIINELNWVVEELNNYFVVYLIEYNIPEIFTTDVTHEDLNVLHHHFEMLRGRVWDETPIYSAAPDSIRWLINQLNEACHELENLIRVDTAYAHRCSSSGVVMCMYGPQGGIRHEMESQDFDVFVNENLPFGTIRMHYAQAGKTHREAWFDNDDNIHDENITGIRYLSGEFDIELNCGPDGEHLADEESWSQFLDWCTEKGLDTTDSTLALGWAPLADMDKSQFAGMSDWEIMMELYNYDDICTVELYKTNNDQQYLAGKKNWDYTWRDLYHQQKYDYFEK